jgi:hypothetical protein
LFFPIKEESGVTHDQSIMGIVPGHRHVRDLSFGSFQIARAEAIEAAQNATDLQKQMVAWGPSGCARLGFSLGFDYLFMAAYVTAIGLGCAVVAGRARAWLHLLGMILAYAQIIGSWRNRERSPATVMSCFAVVLEGNE